MSREMKHSGIEWIGEIPKEWRQYRIKYNTFLKGRIGWQGLNSNDFIDEGYCLITGTDFDNKGGINWNTCYRISKERFDEDELLHVKEGDLLMTKDGTVGKMAIIKVLPEEASLNSHLLIIRQLTNLIDNSFLYWAMLSDVFKGFCLYYQSGTIMSSISQSTLGFFACYCPPLSEQQKIANYLDRVCGEVDEMIALQEQMIDELKAYKQSVITEAVTKGLNPDVPMRDSGIDWIGEVPKHWELSRLKYFSSFINGFAFSSDVFTLDIGCKVIRIGDISQNLDFEGCVKANIKTETLQSYRIKNNDIVIAMSGATTGKCCIAKDVEEAYINQRVGIIRCDNYSYVYYSLQTDYFVEYINLNNAGSAQPNVSGASIGNFPLLVPSIEEQQTIASYLDAKCAEIDALIAIKQAKIEELKEYKKSVIYEYVTGKKEVV